VSAPKEQYEAPLQGALNELVSAMSALNMPPEPLAVPPEARSPVFLTQCDGWVKHSYEHLHATFVLINEGCQLMEKLRWENFQLLRKLAEAKKGQHP